MVEASVGRSGKLLVQCWYVEVRYTAVLSYVCLKSFTVNG